MFINGNTLAGHTVRGSDAAQESWLRLRGNGDACIGDRGECGDLQHHGRGVARPLPVQGSTSTTTAPPEIGRQRTNTPRRARVPGLPRTATVVYRGRRGGDSVSEYHRGGRGARAPFRRKGQRQFLHDAGC